MEERKGKEQGKDQEVKNRFERELGKPKAQKRNSESFDTSRASDSRMKNIPNLVERPRTHRRRSSWNLNRER